jgi:hypothetical protein
VGPTSNAVDNFAFFSQEMLLGKREPHWRTGKNAMHGVLMFPVVGQHDPWMPTDEQVTQWQALYPDLDVAQELRKALAWTVANPSNRKTARGMPRFLVSWLNRATDRRSGAERRQEPRETPERRAYDDWRQHGCPHTPRCGNFTTCQVVRARKAS